MYMKQSLVAALAVALCSAAAPLAAAELTAVETSSSSPPQCLRLTNATASIYTAISFVANKKSDIAHLPLYDLLAPLDKELPWLSTCLASTNVMSIGLGLLADATKSKCISGLTSGIGGATTSSSNSSNIFSMDGLCASMNTTIFPCVTNVLVDTIEQLLVAGGECCTEMASKIKEGLGQDLKSFMTKLLTRVGDVVCSTKSYTDPVDGKPKNSTCGGAIVSTITGGQDLLDLMEMVQIPSDQACAAMKGQNFTATTGRSLRFFSNQAPLDACFAPMNLLFTDLAKLPMVTNSPMAPMFDAGKCLSGEAIIKMALEENGLMQGFAQTFDKVVADMKLTPAGQVTKIVRDGFSDMVTDFGPMCFHIPNGVSDCVYNATVTYAFAADAPPRPSAGASAEGTSAPSASSSAFSIASQTADMVSAFVAISVSALLSY